jgi:tetratricopeptide (TPR) repeat protein
MTPSGAVADFTQRLLRFDTGTEAILEAVKSFPDDPHVLLCTAAFFLYGQTNETNAEARTLLDRAEGHGAGEKAPLLLRALRHWEARRHDAAASTLEEATTADPHDLLAAKLCEFLYYVLGQQYSGPRFLAHMQRLAPVHADHPDFLAMQSFAYELCGDWPEARRLAERSLAIEARNPWAEHTLSHVTIRQGDIAEGEARLRHFLPQAATCSRPVHSHTAWHLALFDLERLDFADARTLFRSHIWGFAPELVGEQIDAIALLWRMELAGADAGPEWSALADRAERHVEECFMPFLSAHHAYALARANRTEAMACLLDTVEQQTEPVWQQAGIPAIRAALAAGQGDWARAADHLVPAMPKITSVGGSDAQDDLFRQTCFAALAKSGRKAEARTLLDEMTAGKKATGLDNYFRSLT